MANTNPVGSSTPTANTSSSAASSSNSSSAASVNPLDSLKPQDFLNMLVAELQDQDPTDPVSNTEILQETSQISQIQTNDSLNTTLQSVLLGQNVATGSTLINQTVTGLDGSGNQVNGTVNSVSISDGTATLNVGGQSLPLANVTSVSSSGSSSTNTNTTGS